MPLFNDNSRAEMAAMCRRLGTWPEVSPEALDAVVTELGVRFMLDNRRFNDARAVRPWIQSAIVGCDQGREDRVYTAILKLRTVLR